MKKFLILFVFVLFSCSGSDDDSITTLTIENKDAVADEIIEVKSSHWLFKNLLI